MNAIRVLIGMILLSSPVLAQPDMSGKWEFNAARSSNVGMMAQMKLTAAVRQTRDEMVITNVSGLNGKNETSELRFDLTGKPVPNANPMEAVADTVTKWEGNRLVTTWTSAGSVQGTKSVRTEIRSLSDDGRVLTVESRRGTAPPLIMFYERR